MLWRKDTDPTHVRIKNKNTSHLLCACFSTSVNSIHPHDEEKFALLRLLMEQWSLSLQIYF